MKEPHKAFVLWWLFLTPAVAFAAEQVVRTMDGSPRFWVAALAVIVLSLMGWGASSLKTLAGWDETRERRYEILQGVLVSMLAGHTAYYGGYFGLPYLPAAIAVTVPEVVCFIAAAIAAYGGARFLETLRDVLLVLLRVKAPEVKP